MAENDIYDRISTMEQLILKNINMTINKGERVSLVGENCSGKTTIAKLLLNFYQH